MHSADGAVSIQDGWEGPCTCSFAPMQGLLTIAEHSSSSGSPSKSGARCEHQFLHAPEGLPVASHCCIHAQCKVLTIVTVPAGLIRLKSRQGSKPQLPLRVRVPHTTQIRTVGDGAVELEFTSLDPLLGALNPPAAVTGFLAHMACSSCLKGNILEHLQDDCRSGTDDRWCQQVKRSLQKPSPAAAWSSTC